MINEIIKKPWGKEEIIEINKFYMVKKLTMLKGNRCSLQYHEIKKETIFILSGKLKIHVGKDLNHLSSKIYGPNDYISIDCGVLHRMEGVEDCVYIESSTPEIDDVIRVSDDYNRIKSNEL